MGLVESTWKKSLGEEAYKDAFPSWKHSGLSKTRAEDLGELHGWTDNQAGQDRTQELWQRCG